MKQNDSIRVTPRMDKRREATDPPESTADADTAGSSLEGVTPGILSGWVRLAYRLLWNREDAEDAVQEALSVAHRQRADLRDPSKRLAWVTRIVVQRCRLFGRERARWKAHEVQLARELLTASDGPEPELADDAAVARDLVQRLPDRQREAIVLRFLEGKGYEEIAELLDISPSTCRVHVHAGLESMRLLAGANHVRASNHRMNEEHGP